MRCAISSMAHASVWKATQAAAANWNARSIVTVSIVWRCAVARTAVHVITFQANVRARPVSLARCAMKRVPMASTAVNASKNANARMAVNAIRRAESVSVRPAGPETCAPINANKECTERIVSNHANASMADIVIISRVNANVRQASWATSVWIVVPATCSAWIVHKLVVVKMALRVIPLTEPVHVRKDGRVSIAPADGVRTMFTAKRATKHANARKKIRECAIRGRVNAIARLAGAAYCVIGHVHSWPMERIVICSAIVKMARNVHRWMARAHVRRDIVVEGAMKCARRARTVRIAHRNADAKMKRRAMRRQDSASVRSVGRDIDAIGRVMIRRGAKTARRRAIVSTMARVIHKRDNVLADLVMLVIIARLNVNSVNSGRDVSRSAIAISIIPFRAIMSMAVASASILGRVSNDELLNIMNTILIIEFCCLLDHAYQREPVNIQIFPFPKFKLHRPLPLI